MVLWLMAFAGVLSLLVFAVGAHVHEHAEHAAWRSLLDSELRAIDVHLARDPGYRWQDTDTLRLYRLEDRAGVPAELQQLDDGLHDGVDVGGRLAAVMVRRTRGLGRVALVLDIDDFHELEAYAERSAVLGGVILVLVTALTAWLGVGRLVRPLAAMAGDIGHLRPEAQGQRVEVARGGSRELHVIADALNDYVQRNRAFVERERVFVSTASHELRTPVAVIIGALELALDTPGGAAGSAAHVQRAYRAARGMEQLLELLLVLARDPVRLAGMSEHVALVPLIEEVVEDHRHLLGDKLLRLELSAAAPCVVLAPPAVVRAAIGNLLRNAIESSDSGTIRITVSPVALVAINDPGHGMSTEEIGALHARLARRGDLEAQDGIGLELVARLCEHLGWRLEFQSLVPRGTRALLDLGASLRG